MFSMPGPSSRLAAHNPIAQDVNESITRFSIPQFGNSPRFPSVLENIGRRRHNVRRGRAHKRVGALIDGDAALRVGSQGHARHSQGSRLLLDPT